MKRAQRGDRGREGDKALTFNKIWIKQRRKESTGLRKSSRREEDTHTHT